MATGSFKLPISSGGEEWVRPADWLPMPTVLSTDNKFVGLYAVFPEGQNYAAFTFATSLGQYQVDWGDGTVTLHNNGFPANHEYNYATVDNSTITSRGYKQAMIVVTAVSGVFTACNLQVRFVTSPIQNQNYATGFLDCILSMPNANVGNTTVIGGATVSHRYVERFDIKSIGGATTTSSMFQNCSSLESVPLFNTINVTNMNATFSGCASLKIVPLFNTINVSNMANMFNSCSSLQTVPLFNTTIVTTTSGMFGGCLSLQSVPLFNTANVNNMSVMFSSCLSINSIPNFSTTSITPTSGIDFGGFNQNNSSLDRVEMAFARTVSLQNGQLSRTALVEIFTNLVDRTSTTSATITISGNWGASALTAGERAIATGKNWVIVG